MAISPKQERFCQEYILDMNGTQAAIRAGYSPKTANVQASDLLAKPNISSRVSELKAEQAERVRISADDVLLELKRLAFADLSQAFDDAGFMKPLKDIPEDVRRALVSLEVSEIFGGEGDQKSIVGHRQKPRFHDKTKALELLGKHLKLFADRMELTGKNGDAIEVKRTDASDEELEAAIARLEAKRHQEKQPE